jgi:polysaccharide pyruvyl transferase CsaB
MKVVLSGYYGFANTGDEAILLAITRELKRLGHTPVVLSQTPADTAQKYGVSSYGRMKPLELLAALWSSDALLSGGGGLLQDKTSARTLTYYLAIIRIARFFGKKVAIFNQSIGPLSSDGEKSVASVLKGINAIVREKTSQTYLERLGIPTKLGGDPALLLEAKKVTRDANTVVLAPRGGQPGATAKLAELARELLKNGKRVIALSFQPGVDTNELETFKTISGVQLLETADPDRALELIASAGAVVGVRLHAVILGAAAGTAFYGISYDPKVAAFCQDAGALSLGTDFDVNVLLKAILEAQQPDWNAVNAMRDRARASFSMALMS